MNFENMPSLNWAAATRSPLMLMFPDLRQPVHHFQAARLAVARSARYSFGCDRTRALDLGMLLTRRRMSISRSCARALSSIPIDPDDQFAGGRGCPDPHSHDRFPHDHSFRIASVRHRLRDRRRRRGRRRQGTRRVPAKAQAHDAVASTVALGKYTVEVDDRRPSAATTPHPTRSSTTWPRCCPATSSRTASGPSASDPGRRHQGPCRGDLDVRASSGSTTTSAPGR